MLRDEVYTLVRQRVDVKFTLAAVAKSRHSDELDDILLPSTYEAAMSEHRRCPDVAVEAGLLEWAKEQLDGNQVESAFLLANLASPDGIAVLCQSYRWSSVSIRNARDFLSDAWIQPELLRHAIGQFSWTQVACDWLLTCTTQEDASVALVVAYVGAGEDGPSQLYQRCCKGKDPRSWAHSMSMALEEARCGGPDPSFSGIHDLVDEWRDQLQTTLVDTAVDWLLSCRDEAEAASALEVAQLAGEGGPGQMFRRCAEQIGKGQKGGAKDKKGDAKGKGPKSWASKMQAALEAASRQGSHPSFSGVPDELVHQWRTELQTALTDVAARRLLSCSSVADATKAIELARLAGESGPRVMFLRCVEKSTKGKKGCGKGKKHGGRWGNSTDEGTTGQGEPWWATCVRKAFDGMDWNSPSVRKEFSAFEKALLNKP